MAGMQGIGGLAAFLLIGIIIPATSAVAPVHAAASASLSVALLPNVLEASRNNTLAMEILNVGGYLTELDIVLTIPPPIVLFGDNHWIRSSFLSGDSIRANLTVFAPTSAAGMTLQGSVMAVYRIVGETIRTTETHAVSFLVRGWIRMEVYEITVDPYPTMPGAEITVSGNLLNRGIIPAMYANVSLATGLPLVASSVSPTYVGQVDPNAPAPFTVSAAIDPDTPTGDYELAIQVYYSDDLHANQSLIRLVRLPVISERAETTTTSRNIVEQLLSDQMLQLAIVVVIILVVIGAYLRRRRGYVED